jgi:hypothetical protein
VHHGPGPQEDAGFHQQGRDQTAQGAQQYVSVFSIREMSEDDEDLYRTV